MPASPLLDPDDTNNAPPSLSANSGIAADDPSPLERLITLSTPPPNSLEYGVNLGEPLLSSNEAGYGRNAPFSLSPRDRKEVPAGSASMATVIAGTLCVLQFCFVWGSFLSNSWFDTFLRTTVAWQTQYLPMLDGLVVVKVKSTTLASILSALNGAGQHAVFLALLFTSLLIPCLCMILCPTWTHGDHKDRLVFQQRDGRPDLVSRMPRMIFEWLARTSMLGLFSMMILDIGTSSISLSNEDTNFILFNTPRGGLIAYALGMSCALGVFVILRIASYQSGLRLLYGRRITPEGRGIPPARAFRLPWQGRSVSDDQMTPFLNAENQQDETEGPSSEMNRYGLKGYQLFTVHQLSLISSLGWLPALFLPMYEVSYSGLASEYMETTSFKVRMWEFPAYAWQRATDANTEAYMLMSLGIVLLFTVYILPIFANGLAVGIWTANPDYSRLCRIVLCCIHPLLCGPVFAISIFAGAVGYEPLTSYLIDQEPSGLCSKFQEVSEDTCLAIVGKPLIGAWFVLLQAIALEVLVVLSLIFCEN